MDLNIRDGRPGLPQRKPSLNADHAAILRATTKEQPRSALDDVARELCRRAGTKASTVTVLKALSEAGVGRLKPLRRAAERAAAQALHPSHTATPPCIGAKTAAAA